MPTIIDTENLPYIGQLAAEYVLVAEFLSEHTSLLEELTFEAMEKKLGTSYKDTPYVSVSVSSYGPEVTMTVRGPGQRETMRALRKAIGGKWEKQGDSFSFNIGRQYPDDSEDHVNIKLSIEGERDQVCKKVVVGTKTVHHKARPAVEERTEQVEEVEWVCGNLLDD